MMVGNVECDSLADGDKRRLREAGQKCECKDGWGGINCNGMCSTSAVRVIILLWVELMLSLLLFSL